MNQTVYLAHSFLKPLISLLASQWTIAEAWTDNSLTLKSQASALATTVWDKIDASYLSQFPNLQIICHLGIGTDNIDHHYLQEKDIILLSQPDAGVQDTAELALTLMLTLSRKIILNDNYARSNHWVENKSKHLGHHLKGKQLGLVGFGKIGSKIAQFSHALGMSIAYTSKTSKNNQYQYHDTVYSLAKVSDFLVICCSATADTYHLINKEVLETLGASGYLINVSRGSVVDQDALIDALQKHRIAGAGLDVYTEEPYIPLALRELSNTVLSPHMGSSTIENLEHMFQLQANQLNHYLTHQSKQISIQDKLII